MDLYLGSIVGWAPTFAPQFFSFCQGQLMSIQQYTALYSLLGTTYGGNGSTNFSLPDLRGRVPVGAGYVQGAIGTNRVQGQAGGAESTTISTTNLPSHTHGAAMTGLGASGTLKATTNAGDTKTPVAGKTVAVPNQINFEDINIYGPAGSNTVDLDVVAVQLSGTPQITIGNTGSGQSFNNMQPFQVIQYIIAIQGLYPSRN